MNYRINKTKSCKHVGKKTKNLKEPTTVKRKITVLIDVLEIIIQNVIT